jgi:TolB-like protein
MNALRKLAAILAADVAGYSRLTGLDEEGTLKRLRKLRRELINPAVALHRGRVVKTTGDGILIEFPSVVDAVRCALDVQRGMDGRNADIPADQRVEFRVGINVGDVVVEGDDLLGDGVNVAARLEGISEPGGICISEAAYHQVRDKLDATIEDAGEQQLKNIARPVRTYRVRLDRSPAQAKPALPLPDKPSIAVLPFQNMSGDPEQEYFADGVVEDIITALSRFKQLFVIDRNSSFTYKGRPVDVKQVGRELGVRYVLEGSVRKSADRVRITSQLIDATKGAHLWADRFDSKINIEDIFDLQDRVTQSVVGQIAPKIDQAEIERSKRRPTENLEAYDYLLRAKAIIFKQTKEALNEVLQLCHHAIQLDPSFASAYGVVAWCITLQRANGFTTDRERDAAEVQKAIGHAVDFGADDPLVLAWSSFALGYVVHDLDGAAALIDRAVSLNSNSANVWAVSAWIKVWLGQPEIAIDHAARAMRLSPFDPMYGGWHTATAFAHFMAGRYEEAVVWAERARQSAPNLMTATRIAAASYAFIGRIEEAKKLMARIRSGDPTLRVSTIKDRVPLRRPEDLARYEEGMRKAGLPE